MNRILLCLSLSSCAVPHLDIRAQSPARVFKYGNTIELGEITDTDTVEPLAGLKLLSDGGAREATLRIDSPGGSVFVGLRFIRQVTDLKKQSGMRINCVVDGAAYSMAAVVLESPVCDTRLATPQSTVLFHNGHSSGAEGTAEEIASAAHLLEALNGALAAVVAVRLGITPEEYRARIAGKDWPMDARGALRDHVIDAVVPQAEIAPPGRNQI